MADSAVGALSEHLVAYLDLLGFREAVATETDRRLVVELLRKLAAHKGNFAIAHSGDENNRQYSIRPAVTAFSDNIVISYPIREMIENKVALTIAALYLSNIVGFVAWNALERGFLIRGGVALGELYHADGIVAGRAMVEAYGLESKVAVYPRVVYSMDLANHPAVGGVKLGFTDQDGLFCVHYMREAILRTSFGGEAANLDIKPWVEQLRKLCKESIAKFDKAGDLRRLSKWNWFSAYLERTIGKMDPKLIDMTNASKLSA